MSKYEVDTHNHTFDWDWDHYEGPNGIYCTFSQPHPNPRHKKRIKCKVYLDLDSVLEEIQNLANNFL